MEIILARHGKPRLHQQTWVAPRQLADWIRAYNEADIVVEDAPAEMRAEAAKSTFIVSSPQRRCVESMRAIAPHRDMVIQDLFREPGLPHSQRGFPSLPLPLWTALLRGAWFLGYSANSESLAAAQERARSAADWLVELAREHQSVFVMGHGIMTALVAQELTRRGWRGPRHPAHGYWQFSVYRN
jgi:broad specificity phosphatase PhoE